MEITYSIFIVYGDREIPLSALTETEKREVANYLRRTPLKTIGQVKERGSA